MMMPYQLLSNSSSFAEGSCHLSDAVASIHRTLSQHLEQTDSVMFPSNLLLTSGQDAALIRYMHNTGRWARSVSFQSALREKPFFRDEL